MSEVLMLEKSFYKDTGEDAEFINEVIKDFWVCCLSREVSLLGRKEVLTGKAKFGILGDGKEVPQVAMARAFKKGDHRAGYYRDQTFMFALGLCTVEQFFGQLYADPTNDPFSGGRQMNAHFATPYIDENGEWIEQKSRYNISSDISPTGGQMARALGLAYASNKYRSNKKINESLFSDNGDEVCFCTIGDASTSEGIFFETINAASVIKAPLAISVWDDGYGISVPKALQTTKGNISEILEGFRLNEAGEGMYIHKAKAWDYPNLVEMYVNGIEAIRKEHVPALFHIEEVTQPQGHSTSGSHERYKSEERLQWEAEHDCIDRMAQWMIDQNICTEATIKEIKEQAKTRAAEGKENAWKAYQKRVKSEIEAFETLFNTYKSQLPEADAKQVSQWIKNFYNPTPHEIVQVARKSRQLFIKNQITVPQEIDAWLSEKYKQADKDYHTHLYAESDQSALNVKVVKKNIPESAKAIPGFQILNQFFDQAFEKYPNLYAFGEDVGKIGDVNQGFAGLQKKYGEDRIFDTGIREWSIIGQALGMAMRGLRPIAEIQYLDYLMYALPVLTDDLATLRYRSDGIQQAPAIIRTRGHRLEGVWHAGSHLGMIIHALRGLHILVPRDMTQAAGFYNTLLQSNDPALVIECLNGYRLREAIPDNLGDYTTPLGVPEILEEGDDLTIVTYGSCVRLAQEAVVQLKALNISAELIDVQSLVPFDIKHSIQASISKTNKVIFLDEDVPGGATAYMMQQVLEEQKAYYHLDVAPKCISAKAHRPPYGSDGDYYTKPNTEDIVEAALELMHDVSPYNFPLANYK